MSHKIYSLILASGSPRRKEFLGYLNVPFKIIVSQVEEISPFKDPSQVAQDLARLKGKAVYDELRRERAEFGTEFFPVVIGADTLVTLDRQILGKPKDVKDAEKMLMFLSGKVHQVITGVWIGFLDKTTGKFREDQFACQTEVEFADVPQDFLRDYLLSGDPMDKAGSYGIQGQALTFISSLRGSYSNVVGLPIHELAEKLKAMLGFPGDLEGKWRTAFE